MRSKGQGNWEPKWKKIVSRA